MLSCGSKEEDVPAVKDSKVMVSLIAAPATIYDEVNIDIQGLRIHIGSEEDAEDDSDEGWLDLIINRPGIQNILEFTGGSKFILTETGIPPRFLSQIRLILGQSNSVKIGDENFPCRPQVPNNLD